MTTAGCSSRSRTTTSKPCCRRVSLCRCHGGPDDEYRPDARTDSRPCEAVSGDGNASVKSHTMRPRRHAVPRLKRVPQRQSPLFAFLNTSLGLWLLSAVFLYGTGAAYALWHAHHEEQLANRHVVERLDMEIAYRFSTVLGDLRSAASMDRGLDSMRDTQLLVTQHSDGGPGKIGDMLHQVHGWLPTFRRIETLLQSKRDGLPRTSALLLDTANGHHPSLYVEYSTYTLEALLITLKGQLPVDERPDVDNALRFLVTFAETTPENDANRIKRHLVLSRWRLGFKQCLECPDNDPLCVRRDNLFGFENISSDSMSKIVSIGFAVQTAPDIVRSLGDGNESRTSRSGQPQP